MSMRTRRELFADVGRGMFLAGLGPALAADLGLAPAWAADEPGRLTFGDLEPLVSFIQDTPPEKLLPATVAKLRSGTDLKTLVAAAALANARAFGGEDYTGYHTLMALVPAFQMAGEEADEKLRPLAVLKVLVRNCTCLKASKRSGDTLQPVNAVLRGRVDGEQLRDIVRKGDLAGAETAFNTICASGSADDALNALMYAVDDAVEVHRVVLVSRSFELLDFVGKDRAHALLRQSVHYCVAGEKQPRHVKWAQPVRDMLPKVLDAHKLLGRPAGTKSADDGWVSALADAIFRGTPDQAADAAAAALAEGFATDAVGEAIAVAANQLILRDEGRPQNQTAPNKPVGSVHGDSIGVHGCDSANAWRNLARFGDRRTQVTSLLLGAYQVARDRVERGGDFLKWEMYPRPEHREAVAGVPAESLVKELDAAIRKNDQARAAALTARIGADSKDRSAEVFALLRGFAVSEDGALHAEKFYRTCSEEFGRTRPAFRWRQLVALARVTASEYGQPAPGYDEAKKLLTS